MNPFDDLPKHDRNHAVEEMATAAFRSRLVESGAFILQSVDPKDYGVDCQIEVVDGGHATNARIQVQLKGTERALNADGSLGVEVSRTNFNYLAMQSHGFYVCYHVPTRSLRACSVEAVLRQYDHDDKDWTAQKTLTVSFREELTVERLASLAELIRSGTRSSRDRRVEQVTLDAAAVPAMLRSAVPAVHVPPDPAAAAELLSNLLQKGADDIISAAFDEFAAVLGTDGAAMGAAYMAEINRGMDGHSHSLARIEKAIEHFRSRLGNGRYQPGGLHYTIGNAHSALGDHQSAKTAFEAAAADAKFMAVPSMAAQVLKNLGSSIELLGDSEGAITHYCEALRLVPDMPEAHNALGNHYVRVGRYGDALEHFDRAIWTCNGFVPVSYLTMPPWLRMRAG